VRPAAPGGFRYGRFWLTQACCVIKGGPISDRSHLIKLELMAHPTYALNVVVVLPPQTETRRGYKDGYYSRPVGASFFFCVFLSSGSWAPRTYFKCRNLRADSEGRTLAPRTPASGGRLCIVWPEAACYRPRRVPGGDGHIESLPAAGLLVGSGHYPLCRGWNRPPETSAPFGGPGCAGCFGTRLEVLGVDGLCRWWGRQAPPIRLPDEACRLGVVGIPCYVPRTGRVPALTD
jgi:hypothetical protein